MISLETSKIVSELEEYLKETTRKLESMVRGFAYHISQTAIANTPLGDANAYFSMYQARRILQPKEGFARGSWQVSETGQFVIQEFYTFSSGDQALSLIQTKLANYKLGETLYIGNKGYYIRSLENNSSPQTHGLGIMQPTLDNVMSTYQVDLKRLFDQG